MFVVDTNILVYGANADSPSHERYRELVSTWRRGPDVWFLTWGIVFEFLRVVTHPRVLARPWDAPSAWSYVEGLLASRGLVMLQETERHAAVARLVLSEIPALSGNLVHDARTAILMREHGIHRIVTRDTDFRRFPFLEVVDPFG